jgi:extracellular elastinolytic metalloproteinase
MKKLITSVKKSSKALILGSLMLGATASFAQDKKALVDGRKSNAEIMNFRGSNAYQGVVRIKFQNTKSVERRLESLMAHNPTGRVSTSTNSTLRVADFPELTSKNQQFGATSMKRVFRPAGKFEAKHQAGGLHLWYEIKVEKAADLDKVLQAYSEVADISVAEPRYEMSLNVLNSAPNDPQYSTQANHYDLINTLDAWGLETGSSDVVVAIEDQGVDYTHPDLVGHMWTNSGEVAGNGIDDDTNGYVDDYYGYNFGDNSGSIAIDYHGTHVGGTVSAETNNGVGVAGVAGGSGSNDGVRLMTLSVFGNSSNGGFDEAFIYAADNGAIISQNSWGGGAQSTALENAIDYFIANAGGAGKPLNGGLVVFAAGNSNSQTTGAYPGNYSPVVAVASTTYNASRSSFSNYGTWVDIAAPGSDILSTYPVSQGSYNTISGTSMACPHVSGVAALVASKNWREGNPLTAAQLRNALESTANFNLLYDANTSTYDGKLGAGMLDAYAALGGTGGGGGGNPTACTSTISSFPYAEGFESGNGAWSQASGDDLDWTRQTAGTPSGSTGPTAASAGSYYMYVEASSPNYPSKTTYFNSPCFDLSGASAATFTFDYNMNGAAMGSLTLQASTDGATWSDAWTISGDQGTAWKSASVNLASYAGAEVRLRLKGTTGSNYTSDICVDKIELSTGSTTPTCNVPTGLASSAIAETSFTVSWGAISGAASYDVEVNGSIVSDDITATSVNLTGAAASTTYSVKVRTNCSSSSSAYSSALSVTTSTGSTGGGCSGGISSFPYSESFESGLGAWSQGSGDDLDWARDSGGTPSGNTGPSTGSNGSWYMYVEASSPNYPSKTTYLNSPCFDLSSASAATYGFDYHMNGANMGSLTLQASTDNGSSWVSVWTESGSKGTEWQSASVDLATYVGASVQLRFVGVTGAGWSSDIAVDDISLTTGSGGGGGGGGTSAVTLTLVLDQYPAETAWTLKDGSGTTVASGDGYTTANSTVTENFNLPAGCYDFSITDSYGDGICCTYGNGSYTLTNAGSTLATGGAYGSGETKNVCVDGVSSVNSVSTINSFSSELGSFDIMVYPNPAKSEISFSLSGAESVEFSIFDMTGRKVKFGTVGNQGSVSLYNLSKGVYIVKAQSGEQVVTKKVIKE